MYLTITKQEDFFTTLTCFSLLAEFSTHMPQWLGSGGFDVAIPGAGAITYIFKHTKSWVIAR